MTTPLYGFNSGKGNTARVAAIMAALKAGEITQQSVQGIESLAPIFGAESFSLSDSFGGFNGKMGPDGKFIQDPQNSINFSQANSTINALKGILDTSGFETRVSTVVSSIKNSGLFAGTESFSMAGDAGASIRQKAATLELNADSNKQFDAAEAMYPTIQIANDKTLLTLPVEVAGVGTYNLTGTAADAYEDFRPIVSTLTDATYNPGDDLKVVPVFVDNPTDKGYGYFVDKALWPAKDETYDSGDLLGRETHKTNFLVPRHIGNIMNICKAPGAPNWGQDDELEDGSIRVSRVLFKVKTKDGEGIFALDTSKTSGNALRPAGDSTSNSTAERGMRLTSRNVIPGLLLDKDGKNASALFASLGEYKPELSWSMTMTYNRDTRSLEPQLSVSNGIYRVVDSKKVAYVAGSSKTPEDVAALITAQAVELTIIGYELKLNHNNKNWSRYGQTIVYSSTDKHYYVRERTPLYVKYPMSKDDTNAEVLARCIKSMGLMISRNMTFDAFKEANEHMNYLLANNGKRVVNINDVSSDVLPGQFHFNTTGSDEEFSLKEKTSTLDSKDALSNVQAVLINIITDAITDIRIRSGFSAIKEIDKREERYTIVAHAALAPFLMTTGDVRTFGHNVKFDVVETNVPTEIGNFWIFPQSNTKGGDIDVYGGMGFCLARELFVIEGEVHQSDRHFRMLITQPAYQHHSIGVICARRRITDIAELLAGGGILTEINDHLVTVKGALELPVTTDPEGRAGNEIDIDKPNGG